MNTEKKNQAWYKSTFEEVHASERLLRKVEAMTNKDQRETMKKRLRTGYAAAAAIAVLVFSNVISYAASGHAWILTVTMPDGEVRQMEVEPDYDNGASSYTFEYHPSEGEEDSAVTASMESVETDLDSDNANDVIYSALEEKDGRTCLVIDNKYRVDITEDFKDGSCKGSVKKEDGQYFSYEVTGTLEEYDIQVELVEVTIK